MGLWEFLRQWSRGRLVVGVLASILLHLGLVAGGLWGLVPELAPHWKTRPGDTLIVELPRPEEEASAGRPAPPAPPSPPPRAEARAAPPAPRPQPAPPRREAAPPREERRVARAPEPEPPPRAPEPAPRAPEPVPAPPAPVPPATEPAPRTSEPPPPVSQARPAEVAPPSPPAPPAPEPAVGPSRPGGGPQIASLPPAASERPSVNDVRAALRAGAGGRGQGRGGIEGDPIALDSPDARYSDYLEQIRRKIKEKWGFPCVRNVQTRTCEHHTTSLDVQFGILKDGRVQFVEIVKSASHDIYDEYAVNAIKLASPFPPVPAAMMRMMRAGSTGVPISARFSYVVESSLTNLLR